MTVGNQNPQNPSPLITNQYEQSTGNLLNSTYGNGNTIKQEYDSLNRLTKQTYDGIELFDYVYNDSGNLGYLQDRVNGVNYNYLYDFADRLVLKEDTNGYSTSFTYDKNNNVKTINDSTTGDSFTTTNAYDGDNRVTSVTTSGGGNSGKLTTIYDTGTDLGRIISKTLNSTYTTLYTYTDGFGAASGATSKAIASIKNGTNTISYTYDANGNIQTINDGTNTITYTYNELNEVIREDNGVLNKTVVYNYDNGGNILSKVQYLYTTGTLGTALSTINYGYTDGNWKDKLTSYDGHDITYDSIGNPKTYNVQTHNGYTYKWERGRELASLNGNDGLLTTSYKYDSNGIRTQKIVNGTTTNYRLIGDNVTFEYNYQNGDYIYYTYDPNGQLVSMNLNGTEYFYVRNAQNDIIRLVDKTGATVASYVYDTWGKLVSIKDGSGNDVTTVTTSVGYKNPYRYRGYRYDTETGLYYCNSRYYNPEWGRFLNADTLAGKPGELLSHNMFAYCRNNPVSNGDPTGKWTQIYIENGNLEVDKYDDETNELISSEHPDYITLTISAGPGWGVSGTCSWDAYGNRYSSLSVGIGKSWFVSASLTYGSLHSSKGRANPEEIKNFLTGLSFNACSGFGVGAGITLSNSDSLWVGTEDGIYSPQIGMSGGWGWKW